MNGNHNICETAIAGLALKPQNVADTAIKGEAIVKPWEKGRRILFTIIGAAMAANDSITAGIEIRRVGTSTWDTVKESDGTTALAFDAAADGDGTLENGAIVGELNLERLKFPSATYEYDAIRLSLINAVAQNVICGATYIIANLLNYPNTTAAAAEQLLDKQLPLSE